VGVLQLAFVVLWSASAIAQDGADEGVALSGVTEDDGESVVDEPAEAEAAPETTEERTDTNPGWRDWRVAESSPNLYGQTGLIRTTSAVPGKSGYFDLGVHGRGFYMPDFLADGTDANLYGAGVASFGVGIFDLVELGLAVQLASNANSEAVPSTSVSTGDFMPSLKLGYAIGPVALGVDVRGLLPASLDGLGPDFANMAVTNALLLTLDLYQPYGIPVRMHVNGGYTFQAGRLSPNAERYFARGVVGHLLAMTAPNAWFYDQYSYGLGLELPFPFVTPYAEVWGQSAIGVIAEAGPGGGAYTPFLDGHLTVTPGVRVSLGRGLSIDLGGDIGIFGTGTGGGFAPSLDNLTNGQPLNPTYAVHVGVSYTFNPFVAEQQVLTRTQRVGGGGGSGASEPRGRIEGCVASARDQSSVEDAFVEIAGEEGMRLVTDARGCFTTGWVELGKRSVTISHPAFESRSLSVDVQPAMVARADTALMPREAGESGASAVGVFRGSVVDARGKPIDASVVLRGDGGARASAEAKGGVFEAQVAPGRWHVTVRSKGHLVQGAYVAVPDDGRAAKVFTLNPAPNKRIAKRRGKKITVKARVPFSVGKPALLPAASFILDDVVDVILNDDAANIEVVGVTGAGKEAGEELAMARAEAVVDYLIAHGVPSSRLSASSKVGNAKGKAKGRVEFVVGGGK
jgi:outer membrane protein OmpA-like peptidoglycan-associated protein